MPKYRGEQGSVHFETGSGTLAQVVGTRSWSFSASKDVLDTTAHGATSRTFIGGLLSGTGSAEIIYDDTLANQSTTTSPTRSPRFAARRLPSSSLAHGFSPGCSTACAPPSSSRSTRHSAG